jgi:hypothetical protein
MAKNTGGNHRIGSVKNRSQAQNPKTGLFTKRNDGTGRFTAVKTSGGSFKGVAHERDGRRK